jgi:hypothetical protein
MIFSTAGTAAQAATAATEKLSKSITRPNFNFAITESKFPIDSLFLRSAISKTCESIQYEQRSPAHQAGLSIRKIAGATGLSSKLFDFDRQAEHNMFAT